MARQPLPPVAAVIRFIDCVNPADLDGLADLMPEDHELVAARRAAARGSWAES